MAKCFALMGWSLPVIESMERLGKPYVVVSFPDFEPYAKENNIPFVSYQLNEWNTNNPLSIIFCYPKISPTFGRFLIEKRFPRESLGLPK